MRVFNYLPVRSHLLALCLPAAVLLSCQTQNRLSDNANMAQVLLGRAPRESVDVMRTPDKTAGNAQNGKALWTYYTSFNVPHYVPGQSYSSSSYNALSDTYTITTTTTPSYTYYTKDFITHIVLMQFLNNKIVGVDYFTHNYTMGQNSEWKKAHASLLSWNRSNANDELDAVRKLEQESPVLATPEMRLKGCLQAAKFDSLDLLVYYLRDCKVPLDTKTETWAYGENCSRNPLGDKDRLVLTEATVREVLTAKNTPKVIDKLKKLGLL